VSTQPTTAPATGCSAYDGNINTCVAAQNAGKGCAWDANTNKCITTGPTVVPTGSGPYAQNSTVTNGMACCFRQGNRVRVYAYSQARQKNGMQTPCTKAAYGNAYQADDWFECPDSTPSETTSTSYESAYTATQQTTTTSGAIRKCSNNQTATCLFGEGSDTSVGPAVCTTNLQESGIKGCNPVTSYAACSTFRTIHTCVAAQQAGKGCAWNATTDKCIIAGSSAVVPGTLLPSDCLKEGYARINNNIDISCYYCAGKNIMPVKAYNQASCNDAPTPTTIILAGGAGCLKQGYSNINIGGVTSCYYCSAKNATPAKVDANLTALCSDTTVINLNQQPVINTIEPGTTIILPSNFDITSLNNGTFTFTVPMPLELSCKALDTSGCMSYNSAELALKNQAYLPTQRNNTISCCLSNINLIK